MLTRKAQLRAVLLLLVVIFCLPAPGQQKAAYAQDKPTISFGTFNTGEGLDIDTAAIEQFAKETGIKVTVEGGIKDDQVLVRMAAGTHTDVIHVGDLGIRRWALAPEGGFLDLTDLIKADKNLDVSKDFYPDVWKVGNVDGKPYAFTDNFSSLAFYVNTAIFEAAGIPIPKEGWTYDDLLKISQELTLDSKGNNATSPAFDPNNVTQWGWINGTFIRFWQPIGYSYGGQLLSDDGQKATGYLDSDAMVKSMEFYRDSVHKYHVAPSNAVLDAQPGVDLFAAGKVAIKGPFGTWSLATYSSNPNLKFAIVPMPAGPKGRYSIFCWAGFGVNKKTKYPQEAYQLAKYLGTTAQTKFVERGLTADVKVAETAKRDKDPLWGPFVAEIQHGYPLDDWKNANFGECIFAPVNDLLSNLLSAGGDKVNVKAELTKIATKADSGCLTKPMGKS